MNRRNFLTNSILALSAFTILPSAETYKRIWTYKKGYKYQDWCIWNPEYLLSTDLRCIKQYITRREADEVIYSLRRKFKFKYGNYVEIKPFLPYYEWNKESLVSPYIWKRTL